MEFKMLRELSESLRGKVWKGEESGEFQTEKKGSPMCEKK
jgi:hypothetical protein